MESNDPPADVEATTLLHSWSSFESGRRMPSFNLRRQLRYDSRVCVTCSRLRLTGLWAYPSLEHLANFSEEPGAAPELPLLNRP